MTYIHRRISQLIEEAAKYFQVIVITGPRQTGKTTLARHLFPDFQYFNLEDPTIRDVVEDDPRGFIFNKYENLIIDEIQRIPQLFSYIQVCVDQNALKKFVITGSNDFALMEKITQSLAGRAAMFTLLPFSFKEVREYTYSAVTDELMFKGFYPGVLVKNIPPKLFYSQYISTYIERDARQVNTIENLDAFRLFIRLLAGRTGSEFNANSLSGEIGVSAPTIRKWLGILKTSYITFTLTPYHTNIEKRLTKTPKVYFYDTGLLCHLLGIYDSEMLEYHPLRGPIFENLAISELIKEKYNLNANYDLYFYRENGGREVDVLKLESGSIDLYEIKSSSSFNKSFMKNLHYLETLLSPQIKSIKLVYDGAAIGSNVINVREL